MRCYLKLVAVSLIAWSVHGAIRTDLVAAVYYDTFGTPAEFRRFVEQMAEQTAAEHGASREYLEFARAYRHCQGAD